MTQGNTNPDNIGPLLTTARSHFNKGNHEQARRLCLQILQLDSGHAPTLQLLGILYAQRGDLAAAESLFTQAVRSNPNNPDYLYNLAKVLELGGKDDAAKEAYDRVLALAPNHTDALINLSSLLLRRSDPSTAAQVAARAVALSPTSVGALNNLGLALNSDRRPQDAEQVLRKALSLDPTCADTHVNLSRVYRRLERYDDAIALLRRAVELNPRLPEALNNLGSLLKFEGNFDEALECCRKAVAIAPNAATHSNLLFNLNYNSRFTPEQIFQEHVGWAKRYAEPLARDAEHVGHDRPAGRKLRVGYISADFRTHPVAMFLQSVIASHDKERFEVCCYSNVDFPDATTEHFKSHSDVWRNIVNLDDEKVADLIRNDRIDILIDLAGHTSGNRLLVLARKPAPIQVTYLGYLGTTGMTAVDYKLTDAVTDPPGSTERYHTERLVRLADGMWCYTPPANAPAVGPLPAARNSRVTFGSFNNSAKVNPEVISAWARILHGLPGSRLLMVTKGDGAIHDHFRAEFQARGIPPDRLDLRRRMPLNEYLGLHGEVDIALDPFPYTGGTTTCHALWMGVPVVTFPGDRPFSRSSASILNRLGMMDWVAESPDEYVRIALAHAARVDELERIRGDLRDRMRSTPLVDAHRFTAGLEAAYMKMWEDYCEASERAGITG